MADTDYTALAVDITGLTVPLHACRYYGLQPDIKVIAPWREWDLNSRSKLISYAEKNNIPVPASKRGEPPFSMDANLLHISYEGYASLQALCLPGNPSWHDSNAICFGRTRCKTARVLFFLGSLASSCKSHKHC